MIQLENEQVIVKIKEMGAELTSVLDRATAYEFIWQGDPNYWGMSGAYSLSYRG